MTVFAALATAATVHSFMRRDDWLAGIAIAFVWAAAALAVRFTEGGAWICVFAFLTGAAGANAASRAGSAAAMLWWALAAFLMVLLDGAHWLAALAFVLGLLRFGVNAWRLPRRIEWDFRADDDGAFAGKPPRGGARP